MSYESIIEFAHGLATGFLGDPFTADDVVQTVLQRLLRRAPGDIRNLRAMVYGGVRMECMNVRARRSRDRSALAKLIVRYERDDAPGPDVVTEQAEAKARVLLALQELSEKSHEAIAMKIFAGMTFEEMAEALALPLGTVQSRYQTAIEHMRKLLREPGHGS